MTISFQAGHKGGIIFKGQSTPTLEERAQYHCIQGHNRRREEIRANHAWAFWHGVTQGIEWHKKKSKN